MSSRNGWDDDENSAWNPILKVAGLLLAVYLSFWIITGSTDPLIAMGVLAVIWGVGFWLYRRRRHIKEWSQNDVPLREYISARRNDNTTSTASSPARSNNLDSSDSAPLSPHESQTWDGIVEGFYDDIYDKKPAKKPKRKKRN